MLSTSADRTTGAGKGAETAVKGLNFAEVPDVLDESGVVAWEYLRRTFAARPDWFRECDRAAVTTYCTAWALHDRAARELQAEGLKVRGRSAPDRGRSVRNPAWQVWRDAATQLRHWSRELGLTPDARSRAGLTDTDPKSTPDTDENPFAGPGI
jgi:P27 family predicted phage terminase small subunit